MGERRIRPVEGGPRFGDRLLLIDESVVGTDSDRDAYVIGAAALLRGDAAVARRLAVEATHVEGGHPRSRPFHHRDEGPRVRRQMLDAVADACEAVFAVAVAQTPRSALEAARRRALGEILSLCTDVGHRPDALLIESREQNPKVVGQNRVDHQVVIEARRAGVVGRSVVYEWAGKDEPLLWLADAIAGSFADEVRGRGALSAVLPASILHVRMVPWPERA
jgi:hypothetical protein